MNTRRIGIRSLFFYLVRRIWIILIAAMCGAVALAGYKYVKDKKQLSQTEANLPAEVEVNDGSTLSDMDRGDVETAWLQSRYISELQSYLENAPIPSVGNSIRTSVMVQYLIRFKPVITQEETNYTDSVETTYQQLLRAYIVNKLYVPELVELNGEYADYGYFSDLVSCDNMTKGVFTLVVYEYDRFPDLAADVRKVLEKYLKELSAKESGLSFTVMKEGTVSGYDSNADTAHRSVVSNLNTYRKAYASALNSFTATEKGYLMYLNGQEGNTGEKKTTAKKTVSISKSYAVVGGILGVVAGIFLGIIFLYLSSSHASTSDYAENVGLRNFGMVFIRPKKSGALKQLLLKGELKPGLFDSNEESLDYAAVRIANYCNNHEIKELALLSSKTGPQVEEAAEELAGALKKQGITLSLNQGVAKKSDALKNLLSLKTCMFVEGLHKGNRQKMQELLQFCKENEVVVIGSVGVAELELESK